MTCGEQTDERRLKLSQPVLSLSVKRGEKIAKENQYSLLDDMNL